MTRKDRINENENGIIVKKPRVSRALALSSAADAIKSFQNVFSPPSEPAELVKTCLAKGIPAADLFILIKNKEESKLIHQFFIALQDNMPSFLDFVRNLIKNIPK